MKFKIINLRNLDTVIVEKIDECTYKINNSKKDKVVKVSNSLNTHFVIPEDMASDKYLVLNSIENLLLYKMFGDNSNNFSIKEVSNEEAFEIYSKAEEAIKDTKKYQLDLYINNALFNDKIQVLKERLKEIYQIILINSNNKKKETIKELLKVIVYGMIYIEDGYLTLDVNGQALDIISELVNEITQEFDKEEILELIKEDTLTKDLVIKRHINDDEIDYDKQMDLFIGNIANEYNKSRTNTVKCHIKRLTKSKK